jgi:hypothetical protein
MSPNKELIEKVESLQNLLISCATGGQVIDDDYKKLRQELLNEPSLGDKLPRYVRTCHDIFQFWQFIKFKYPSYAERREYIWGEFNPILNMLESKNNSPPDAIITEIIKEVDSDTIHEGWQRALNRRFDDPEGAITAARSLLESVCKYILDASKIEYNDGIELPKLYKLTAEKLNLAPNQHTEDIIKQILGGATAVVEGLGALRNKLGDAHGKGKFYAKPETRHAELAVNLAGTIATFLISTWEIRAKSPSE